MLPCLRPTPGPSLPSIPALAIFVALLLASGCGSSTSPLGPTQTPTQPGAPTPPPPATFDLSPFVGVWDLTLRLTDVTGQAGCVGATMRSQIGVLSNYSLSITKNDVTIINPSGDYACTFNTLTTDANSFTTYGVAGVFTCAAPTLSYQCNDGTVHKLMSDGQNIAGRVSGTQISGNWDSDWDQVPEGGYSVSTKAEFSGSKQDRKSVV